MEGILGVSYSEAGGTVERPIGATVSLQVIPWDGEGACSLKTGRNDGRLIPWREAIV